MRVRFREEKEERGGREVGRIGFESLCSLYSHIYLYNDISITRIPLDTLSLK